MDIAADKIGVRFLLEQGFGVLSEESGVHEPERELFAVIDPIDGSTNASQGLPWFATSICVLDGEGPLVGCVLNHATMTTYTAVRGGGAFRDGRSISPSKVEHLGDAIIGLSGYAPRHLGWAQYRALGAIALDLCAVADGGLDGYLDCVDGSHGPWDYLAGMFICLEAGAFVGETKERELISKKFDDRRSPLGAGTQSLYTELFDAYRDTSLTV